MKTMLPLSERNTHQSAYCNRLGLAALLLAALTALTALGGCSGNKAAVNPGDYVEVDNPFSGGAPDENPKVWVLRSSLERGIPRGGALVKKGYEAVAGKTGANTGPSSGLFQAGTTPYPRILVVEANGPHLAAPLKELLSHGSLVRPVAGDKPVPDAEAERFAYLTALSAQPGGGPVLLLAAPQGSGPGARLKADLYDVRGPLLLRSFAITIPQPEKDESQEEATVRALSGLSGAVLEVLNRIPWYARVISVAGDRIYLDAGAESGLKPGQKLSVHRGGEAVNGVGFASGPRLTGFSVNEFVGPDGAYGVSPEALKVLPGDYLELEK